jgi:glycosyltransferase involved in cell wall biosynthesis
MAKPPLVSVILPTYCRAQSGHLRKAIETVLAQGFEDFELIIVDDGSVDGSSAILRDYTQRDTRVRTLRL